MSQLERTIEYLEVENSELQEKLRKLEKALVFYRRWVKSVATDGQLDFPIPWYAERTLRSLLMEHPEEMA